VGLVGWQRHLAGVDIDDTQSDIGQVSVCAAQEANQDAWGSMGASRRAVDSPRRHDEEGWVRWVPLAMPVVRTTMSGSCCRVVVVNA
jgi:hypothetical protein